MSPDVPFHDNLCHTALDSVNERVWLFDLQWRLLFVNRAARKMEGNIGWPSRVQTVGRSLWEQAPELQNSPLQAECRRAARDGMPHCFREYQEPHGPWMEVEISPDASGFSLVARELPDIASLTPANNANSAANVDVKTARENTRFLQRVVQTAPSLIYVHDLDEERSVFVNRGAGEFLGYQNGEIDANKPGFVQCLMHPEDFSRFENYQQTLLNLADDDTAEFEYRMRHADGHWRWYLSRDAVFERDEKGAARSIIGAVTAINERKMSEAALKASHDTFQHLVERSPFGIYVVDADFRLMQVSDGAQKVFSSVRPLLGRDFAEVLRALWPEPFATEVINLFHHTLETGEAYRAPSTIEQRAGNGEVESYDWKIERITLPDGRFGVVCHFYDLSERQRYEEALHDSEARLRAFYDNAPICMGVTELGDKDVLHLYDNPATCRFFGTPPGSTANKWALADLGGHSGVVGVWMEHYRLSEASGEAVHFEHQYFTPEGSHWLSVTVCPIGVGTSNRTRFCYVAEDITDRKRVEAALHESEERFRSTFEQAAVGIAHVGLDGRWLRVNDRLCEIVGYSREEILQSTFADITHPDDVDADWRLAGELLAGERSTYSTEKRYVHREGSLLWVNLTVSLQQYDDGTPQHFIAVIEDIKARKRAENSLKFLSDVDGALNTSLDFQTTLQNLARFCVPQLCDLCMIHAFFGESPCVAVAHVNAEQQSKAIEMTQRYPFHLQNFDFLSGDSTPLLLHHFDEDFLRNITQNEEHYEMLHELAPRSFIMLPLHAQGRMTGLLMLTIIESERCFDAFDCSLAKELSRRASVALERVRLFQEAQRARELAEAANSAKDQFLSIASHELRTPLTPILGWIEILRSDHTPEMREQAFAVLERNARAQLQLVDDILDVSRIVSGKMRFNMKPLELETVIRGAVDSLLHTAQTKKVRLSTSSQAAEYCIDGDAGRLQQVVWNLLSNALKFTPSGGEINLSLRHIVEDNADEKEWAEIAVRDSGAGIAPEFLPYVFERFRQADSSHTRRHGGLGLGLSIVKHIVEMHGGNIKVFSEGEGQGAIFTVCLPLLSGEKPDAPREAGPQISKKQLENVQILVVDDEMDTRDFVHVAMNRVGATVRVAASGREALEILSAWQPHVLICDINMPDMSGHQLIQHIRATQDDSLSFLPALAFSACATQADRQRSLECGFSLHLDKPLLPDELIHAVSNLLKPQESPLT